MGKENQSSSDSRNEDTEYQRVEVSEDNFHNHSEKYDNNGHTITEKAVSYQDSRVTHRTVVQRVSTFYDQQNRVLTSNFAGAEDKDEEDERKQPFMSKEERLSMNLSRYQYLNQRGEIGFWSTLFTFIKVNIVSGFLFLPAGFKDGGWLFSICAIFFISSLTIYCNISISQCTDPANSYSLSRIGFKAAGKCGFYLTELGIAISQICFPCSYANLITQILNNMINLWFGTKDENFYLYIAICLGVILIPMCLVRNVSKFSAMHFIGDLAVLATVISLTYESIYKISHEEGFNLDNVVPFRHPGWAKLLGMCVTSMEGIGVILPIKENMRDKKNFHWVIIIGTFFISIILTGFPLIMYFCYQDAVNEIVLNNLNIDKVYIQAVLLLLMFSVLVVYPVTLFPAFKILENIFCKKTSIGNSAIQEKTRQTGEIENIKQKTNWKRLILENLLRTFIVVATITVGVLSINRFDTLLALAGCGICTPIALIFPSIFHFLLFRKKQSAFRNIVDITIAVVGTSLSITILIFTLIS